MPPNPPCIYGWSAHTHAEATNRFSELRDDSQFISDVQLETVVTIRP